MKWVGRIGAIDEGEDQYQEDRLLASKAGDLPCKSNKEINFVLISLETAKT